ncbi:hypothetical protein [Phytohabitans rumicis]|uniref:Uncharacterized protein n=1 Tax=Phytohabitans rumicis TaxID=1076125 RepID=A0A6V8L333_9ACTN|nr:hypothetical protein [Phytohabitans rumicis]GFJ88536.1 hypothetical protein Prum_021780 [Phytohabitans rumicis]
MQNHRGLLPVDGRRQIEDGSGQVPGQGAAVGVRQRGGGAVPGCRRRTRRVRQRVKTSQPKQPRVSREEVDSAPAGRMQPTESDRLRIGNESFVRRLPGLPAVPVI